MSVEILEQLEHDDLDDEALNENMPTFEHGIICANVNAELRNYLKGKKIGRVVDSSPEYRFLAKKVKSKKGDKASRFSDISFVRQERLPRRFSTFLEIAPDLAIEVVSPTDADVAIEAKVKEYQKSGVPLV